VILAAILASLSAWSCERVQPEQAEPAVETQAWDWTSYPLASRITLSEASARVQSRRTTAFVAPIDGPIEIDEDVRAAGPTGIELEAGRVWARVAPQRLELERRTVQGQRRQLELRRLLFEAIEQPRTTLEARRDLENARRTRDQLRLAVEARTDPLVREVFPDLPAQFGDDVLAAAERLVEVLEENLRLAEDPEISVEEIQLQLADVELEQAELTFDRLAERSELTMPFAGELVLSPQLDVAGSLFVGGGDTIATARGGEIVLHVESGEALWLDVPPEDLVYRARIPGGGVASARFERRETVDLRGFPTLVDRFTLEPDESAASLRMLNGAVVRGRLVRSLERPARLVPKLDLMVRYPDAFKRGDWTGGVGEIWPGASAVAIGLTEIAIDVGTP